MVACRQLGFDVTGYSDIRFADPENPTLEPNMKCIGLRRYGHSRILGHMEPQEIIQDGGLPPTWI